MARVFGRFRSVLLGLAAAGVMSGVGAAQSVPSQVGTYKCAFFGYNFAVNTSSIGVLHITTPTTYADEVLNGVTGKSAISKGTFTLEPHRNGDEYAKLIFHGGLLDGHWAYANRKPNGDRAIIFPKDEGEKTFDPGATWCYGPM
jgi:hypothetical protein